MKTVRIRNTAVATDIVVCEIYHTNNPAEGPSILMSSSVSQSGQFTGDDLYNGIEFQVPDEVSQFYVKNIDRCINIGSGSLTESSTVVEYFTVYPGSGGSISLQGEVTTITSTSGTYRQNFSVYPTLTLKSIPSYPNVFESWHTGTPFTNANKVGSTYDLVLVSGSNDSATNYYVKYQ